MRILTIGGATIDVIASVADTEIERLTMHNATSSFLMLEEGAKLDAEMISSHSGGGAVNSAICMARQGFPVKTLIKLGQDHEADMVLSSLRDEGVDASAALQSTEHPTGKAVIISSHSHNPAIIVNRGANSHLSKDEIDSSLFEAIDLVYITGLSNDSARCFAKIVRIAKEKGAVVAANPGIRQLTYRGGAFIRALPWVDILALNTAEAAQLSAALAIESHDGKLRNKTDPETDPELLSYGLPVAGRLVDLQHYADRLHKIGPACVIVTNGAEGAYICENSNIQFTPSLKTEVKGTTGAGDTFVSTFVAQKTAGLPSSKAAALAAKNAASVVSYPDTQSGLLTRAQLGL